MTNSVKYYGWVLKPGRIDYERSWEWQKNLVKLRREGMVRDTIIMLEHPPVVTVGRDGHEENYKDLSCKPYFIERGGDVTYHGPGQLVVYFIFNLTRRQKDIHLFMANVQKGIIDTLKDLDIEAAMGEEHTGVWVDKKKVASIGLAVKNWITFHGAAINLNTQLDDFKQIKPCGLSADVMASIAEIKNEKVNEENFKKILLDKYALIFETKFDPITLEYLAEEIESQSGSNVI